MKDEMKKFRHLILLHGLAFLLFFVSCSHSLRKAQTSSSKTLQRIAFASCASQEQPQPTWETVVSKSPDLFLFIGDNIYADTEDTAVMKSKYANLAAKPGYQKLLSTCKLLSVWDDHDYGENDGGASYPKKKESQQIFLDFFNVDNSSPRRKRAGIYGAEVFGSGRKKVQVILLDTRYFKDVQVPNNESTESKRQKNIVGWYLPTNDTTATILGKEQWDWLKDQLNNEADVR